MKEEVVKGKLVHKEGKYFLDVAGKMEEIPDGVLAEKGDLKKMVGQEVEVFYSIPKPYVVALRGLDKRRIIICNLPRREFLGPILNTPDDNMMQTALTNLHLRGDLTTQQYETLRGKR